MTTPAPGIPGRALAWAALFCLPVWAVAFIVAGLVLHHT